MVILTNILEEIMKKLRGENLYSEEILGVISCLVPSGEFLAFVKKVFREICRKLDKDSFLAVLSGYGEGVGNFLSSL